MMPDATRLDRIYRFVLETVIASGQAPHYTQIATQFGIAPDAGKRMLHDLMAAGLPNWLHPGTDLIASVAPFNVLPTHYRITIDGEQNGSRNAASKRWRSRGCLRARMSKSTRHASPAVRRCM